MSREKGQRERDRENGRKGGEKIVAETTFSTKGRGGRNERWGKGGRGERRKKGTEREREKGTVGGRVIERGRRGWKTGDSDGEWTERAISGDD